MKKAPPILPPVGGEVIIPAKPYYWLVCWASLLLGGLGCALSSCHEEPSKTTENKKVQQDTIQKDFLFTEKKDSLIQNGEYVSYYKNGVIEMRGTMKDGKRDGLWKSYYEDGSAWSETIYKEGKKDGKTTAWFDNEKKRYEGYYTNDVQSGNWTFWAENGMLINNN